MILYSTDTVFFIAQSSLED